jgi:GAF domain-containing protein
LEQQTASAEILRAIASAPGDATGVLDTIARTARDLFDSWTVSITRIEDGTFRQAAGAGEHGPAIAGNLSGRAVDDKSAAGRAALEKRVVPIEDFTRVRGEYSGSPGVRAGRVAAALAAAPLLSRGKAIGTITVTYQETHRFTPREIELIESFADQAVIAIENARLLDELRESLDNQTASAEILRTIAAAPEEPDKALDAIARASARLLRADGAAIRTVRGDKLRLAGIAGEPGVNLRQKVGDEVPLDFRNLPAATVREKRAIHVPDVEKRDSAMADWPGLSVLEAAGIRTVASTPLMRRGDAIGAMMVQRRERSPFTEKELDQLANFADQAVIAIENARLLDDLNARNRDLSESLEQQNATSEILRAIATTPGDAERVMQVIAENAGRLCNAMDVNIYLPIDGKLRMTASLGTFGALGPVELPIGPGSVSGTAFTERRAASAVHMDEQSDDYPDVPTETTRRVPSVLAVPMLRNDEALGVIAVVRGEAQPFTEAHKALLAGFADQAVIAMENARLLDELQARNSDLAESLEQQTASAEILRAIASAQGEADRVLDTIAETAHRLFGAYLSVITRIEDGVFRRAAAAGPEAATISVGMSELAVDRQSVGGRAAIDMRTVHFDDLWEHADELPASPGVRGGVKTRSLAAAPLIRDGQAIGTIGITLSEVRPFTDKQLALLESFADQAVIAIENARLLSELRESLERRTATAEVLAVISSSPGEVQPVFAAMLENAVRLCDAGNGSVFTASGDMLHRVANLGLTGNVSGHDELPLTPGTHPALMRDTLKSVHVPDFLAELAKLSAEHGDEPAVQAGRAAAQLGIRSVLWVPMVKDNALVGAFVLNRSEARPFTDAQIELIETFASQAVIAIENARLLEELRESLENQTASADILRVISSSAADTQPVFDAIVAAGLRLFPGVAVSIALPDGDQVYAAAAGDLDSERAAQWRRRHGGPRGVRGRPPKLPRERLSRRHHGAHDPGRRGDRRHQHRPRRARPTDGQTARSPEDVRRSGGDRDRERPAAERVARIPRQPDRQCGNPAHHRGRSGGGRQGARHHRADDRPAVRCERTQYRYH